MDRWLGLSKPSNDAPSRKRVRLSDDNVLHSIEICPEITGATHSNKHTPVLKLRPRFSPKHNSSLESALLPEFSIGREAIQKWNGYGVHTSDSSLRAVEAFRTHPYFAIATNSGELGLIDARTYRDEFDNGVAGDTVRTINLKSVSGCIHGLATLKGDNSLLCSTDHSVICVDANSLLFSSEISSGDACFGAGICSSQWSSNLCALATTTGDIMLLDTYAKDINRIVRSAHSSRTFPSASIATLDWVCETTLCSTSKHEGSVKFWDIRHSSRPLQTGYLPVDHSRRGCTAPSAASDGQGSIWCLSCSGHFTKFSLYNSQPEYQIKILQPYRKTHGLEYVSSEWPQLAAGGLDVINFVSVPSSQCDTLSVNATQAISLESPHHQSTLSNIQFLKWNPCTNSLFSGSNTKSWRVWSMGKRRTGRACKTRMLAI